MGAINSNTDREPSFSSLDINANVTLWQAMTISVLIPVFLLLLCKILQLILQNMFDKLECASDGRCGWLLHFVSSKHRSFRRNSQYNNGRSEWNSIPVFDRKNDDENSIVNQEEEKRENEESKHDIPMMTAAEQAKQCPIPKVMESISMNFEDIQKYLKIPGETANIELSLSSHGLRQLSLGDIV